VSLVLLVALGFYMAEWIISTSRLLSVESLLYPLTLVGFITYMHPAYVIFVNRKSLKDQRGLFFYVFVVSAGLTSFFISNLPSCVPTCSLLQYSAILPNMGVSLLVLAFSIDMLTQGSRPLPSRHALSKYKTPLIVAQALVAIAQTLAAVERIYAIGPSQTTAMIVHEIAKTVLLATVPALYILLRTQMDAYLSVADRVGVIIWSFLSTAALLLSLVNYLPADNATWQVAVLVLSGLCGVASTIVLVVICISIWRQADGSHSHDLEELVE